MSANGKAVTCPTCKKRGDWLAGKYGTFCSHRCKLIDLGRWLNEENRISEPITEDPGPESSPAVAKAKALKKGQAATDEAED